MSTTTGNFHNQYTFGIVDHSGGYDAQLPSIQTNAVAVINYLSDFISWNGTLDFYVRFGSPFMFGHDGTGLLQRMVVLRREVIPMLRAKRLRVWMRTVATGMRVRGYYQMPMAH